MKLGSADALLVAKILDQFTPEAMQAKGFTPVEIRRAEWLAEDFDKSMTKAHGEDWLNEEVP